jgi:hypothetical protein
MDDAQRPHNTNGPAVQFHNWELYFGHGVRVPPDVVLRQDLINPERIEQERNTEVRRVLIELYGIQRYMEETGAAIVHESQRGTLYRKELFGDEPIVMVKVLNSTAEPDGTFKTYFLRVPPEVTTVEQGIAWTFGLTDKEYAPSIET